jgi:hypothetical protein
MEILATVCSAAGYKNKNAIITLAYDDNLRAIADF